MCEQSVETVECNLSAVIRPGDRKCLSSYRSLSNAICRECDLSDKIDKLIHPIFKPKLNLNLLKATKGKEINGTRLSFNLIGRHAGSVLDRWESLRKEYPKEVTLCVSGRTKGFRLNGGTTLSKLKPFDYSLELAPQIVPSYYYKFEIDYWDKDVLEEIKTELLSIGR